MKKDFIVLSDFDGTISVKDVNTSIFSFFGNDETQKLSIMCKNREIGLRDSLRLQYESIGIDEKTFNKYVINEMEIDETFFDFMEFCNEKGIGMSIVSGGFRNYIELLFKKYHQKMTIPVFAKRLKVVDNIMVPDYNDVPDCEKYFGPCGICKYEYVKAYKENYRVIYAGDGFMDRCAAEAADVVFAKDGLEEFCKKNEIKYKHLGSFNDIKEYIMSCVG